MSKEKTDFHGGNIYKIFREKNIKEILDYSSNINPYVSEKLKKAIINNLNILERYPDPCYVELRDKIAKQNNVNIENIILGNGATEIIFLYMKILDFKKILIVSPTFSEYERAIKSTKIIENIQIDYFELKENEDFVLDEDRLIENISNSLNREHNNHKKKVHFKKKYDIVIICNPNNPTGKFISIEKMEKILEICNKLNIKLFVDEAFIEFVDKSINNSIINTNIKKDNLFVIRAFTKFFAVPGIRLGYGICFDKKIIKKINEIKEPWSVNNIAELTGRIVLDDKEYIKKTNVWIKEEKQYMYEKLKEIKGIKPYKTEVNFILCKILDELLVKGVNVKILQEKMLEKGVLIRDASNFKYLDNSYFRLAIKDRENNNKVISVLEKCISLFLR